MTNKQKQKKQRLQRVENEIKKKKANGFLHRDGW